MTANTVSITPLDAALGAHVEGIDISRPLSISSARIIEQSLLQYKVLTFNAQPISEKQIVQFGRYLGIPFNHPFVANRGIYNPVSTIVNKPGCAPNSADWHTDVSFVKSPPRLGFLHCEKNPEQGGETQFVDMEACWAHLPNTLQAALRGKSAFHDFAKERELTLSIIGKEALDFNHARTPGCYHPTSRQHPITKTRSLYVNQAHTTRIEGLPEDENNDILSELFSIIENCSSRLELNLKPQHAVLWDQRNTVHRGLPNYGKKERLLRRLGIGLDFPCETLI